MKTHSLPALIGLLFTLTPASAAPIPGLFNTGVDNNGAALPAGAVDPHYQLIVNPDNASANALVHNEGFPIAPAGPWLANTASSKWIAPRAETSGAAGGDYTYRIAFDLTGFDPATAVITGQWSSDNSGLNILVNGVATGQQNGGDFAVYVPFALASSNASFVAGPNTIDFVMNNAAAGYTGLRVEVAGTALPPGVPPAIVQHPQGLCVAEGESLALTVAANGTPPLTYRWRLNEMDLPGQNGTTYTLSPAFMGDDGGYDVVVSNNAGSVTSRVAQVRVGLAMVNASFEADTFTIFPGYVANNGPITGWASPPNHGINPGVGFSPFADNGAIPHGAKVAFLQQDGALSQVVSGIDPAKEYFIEYYENSRLGDSPTDPFVEVRVGVATVVPAHAVPLVGGANPYRRVKSDGFVAGAASLEVAFVKSNPQGGDNTALIDNVCFVELRPGTPPEITQQPVGLVACVGDSVTLFARALGSGPLTYQWLKDGTPVPNETNRALVLANVQIAQEGDYTMVASNSVGQAVTDVARLTVFEPIPDLFNTGVDSSRAALADNSVDPHYTLVQNPDTGSPDAIVQNSAAFPIVAGPWLANSATSTWIGPRLDTSASAIGVYIYRTVIDLTDRDPATVVILGRWATDNPGTDIRANGASTGNPASPGFDAYTSFAIYGTNSPLVAGSNAIDFVVENIQAAGYTGLRVEITKSNVRFRPGIPPEITQQPVSVKAVEGDPVTFTAAATGTAPLTFQWKKDGVDIPGARGASLTLVAVSNVDSGTYTLCVSNSAGQAVTQPVTLCVCWRPLPGIVGTGVDAGGTLLADGAVDPHYRLTASADPSYPGPDAFAVINEWPIASAGPWLANGPASRWIAPRAEQNQLINAAFGNSDGDYTFTTSFDLTGYDVSQVHLQGRWAVDNSGLDIVVNGTGTGNTSPGFGGFTAFTIASGLVAGLNTVEFRINNAPTTPNPVGLRVDLRGLINNQAGLAISILNGDVARLSWGPASPCQRLEVAPTVLGPWVPHPDQSNPQLVAGCTHVVALDAAQDGGGARTGTGFGTLTLSGTTLTLNGISYSGLSGNSTAAHIHGPASPNACKLTLAKADDIVLDGAFLIRIVRQTRPALDRLPHGARTGARASSG